MSHPMLRVFASACAVSALLTGTAVAQETLELGALYPFSGGLAVLGEESFRGFELAVNERNAAGGIQGMQITIVRGDAVDPNQAVTEAQRLISVEEVGMIFGTYSSSRSFAATQVAEEAGVPYFELGAISDPITERGFTHVYRTNPTARVFASAMVDSIGDLIAPALGLEATDMNIAIIHEDSLYGQTVAGYQAARAEELGLNVVEVLPYSAESVDLTPVILRLEDAEADVILQTSYQNDTVLFFRQSDELGFEPAAIIGAGGGYSLRDTMEAVGADIMDGALNVDFTQYATNPEAAPGIDAFPGMYEEAYNEPPRSGHSLANYMGANVIFDALETADSLSPDDVRTAVLAIDIPAGQTPTGWAVSFDESGQNTAAYPFLMQWQDGELVTVYPPEAAVAEPRIGN